MLIDRGVLIIFFISLSISTYTGQIVRKPRTILKKVQCKKTTRASIIQNQIMCHRVRFLNYINAICRPISNVEVNKFHAARTFFLSVPEAFLFDTLAFTCEK